MSDFLSRILFIAINAVLCNTCNYVISSLFMLHVVCIYVCHLHTCLLCYIDHIYECVCMCTLIASHQTLVVSASTLYESELQYSVGGAGIGYPAGGSSTHMHTHACTHALALLYLWGPSVMDYSPKMYRSKEQWDIHCEELKLKVVLDQMWKNTTCEHILYMYTDTHTRLICSKTYVETNSNSNIYVCA